MAQHRLNQVRRRARPPYSAEIPNVSAIFKHNRMAVPYFEPYLCGSTLSPAEEKLFVRRRIPLNPQPGRDNLPRRRKARTQATHVKQRRARNAGLLQYVSHSVSIAACRPVGRFGIILPRIMPKRALLHFPVPLMRTTQPHRNHRNHAVLRN
jgi:hypothetical protein